MNKMMVLAKALDGRKEELARWFDERHMDDLLAVPGFVSAERHTIMPVKLPGPMPAWDFMIVYEIDRDPMPVLQSMAGLMGTEKMPACDALESVSSLSVLGVSQCRRGKSG